MKLALIGCGWIVEFGHLPALLDVHDVEVVAVADQSSDRAERIGRALGLPTTRCFQNHQDVLGLPDVDAVTVATPPDLHRGIVTDAAVAGKHVLCEKPIAAALADADAMIAACDAAHVMLGMCHNILWFVETVEARRLIAAGAIGDVIGTEISGIGAEPWPGAPEYRPGWRRDPTQSGGGAFIDEGVHALYLTEVFHGKPIDAVSACLRTDGMLDTWASCHFHLGTGIGTLNVAWEHGHASLSVIGTDGALVYVFDENAGSWGWPARVIRVHRDDAETVSWHRPIDPKLQGLVSPQMYSDFAAACRGELDYPATGRDGRRGLEVVTAAYQSHAAGEVIRLPISAETVGYGGGVLEVASQLGNGVLNVR